MRKDRNNGCRIKTDLIYKGYTMVVLENEYIRLGVLPGKGTDIIELLYKPLDMDFIWQTELGLRRKEAIFSDFQSQYEGGWQEIFPSLSPKHIYEGIEMEAYGEISLTEWDYEILRDTASEIAVQFSYRLRKMPFVIEKQIRLLGGSAGFYVEEKVTNDSPAQLYADWGHHITFGSPFLQPGSELKLPDRFEKDILPEPGSPGGFEVLHVKEKGIYRLTRSDGLGAEVIWDSALLPFLWIWKDFGGEIKPPYYGKHYNLGLEIFSSPPAESLADNVKAGTALCFDPWTSKHFAMEFRVQVPE